MLAASRLIYQRGINAGWHEHEEILDVVPKISDQRPGMQQHEGCEPRPTGGPKCSMYRIFTNIYPEKDPAL